MASFIVAGLVVHLIETFFFASGHLCTKRSQVILVWILGKTLFCTIGVILSLLVYFRQVGALRVIKTTDDPPKCKGLALVRYMDRESAKKALDSMASKKVIKIAIIHRVHLYDVVEFWLHKLCPHPTRLHLHVSDVYRLFPMFQP